VAGAFLRDLQQEAVMPEEHQGSYDFREATRDFRLHLERALAADEVQNGPAGGREAGEPVE